MLYVILRNGKVLQYNSGNFYCTEEKWLKVRLDDKTPSEAVASIPIDVIERVEWRRPCRVMRERKIPNHQAKY